MTEKEHKYTWDEAVHIVRQDADKAIRKFLQEHEHLGLRVDEILSGIKVTADYIYQENMDERFDREALGIGSKRRNPSQHERDGCLRRFITQGTANAVDRAILRDAEYIGRSCGFWVLSEHGIARAKELGIYG